MLRKRLGAFVLREKVGEFVAEDGGAARFEDDDGRCGFDFGEKLVHDLEEQALGAVECADVVERPSAAKMRARDEDVEARGFEHFGGSFRGRGQEVVIESVGPEEDGSAGVLPACISLKFGSARARLPLDSRRDAGATFCLPPFFERLRSQRWNAALGGDSGGQLGQVAEAGKLGGKIHQSRSMGRGPHPQIEIRERELFQRTRIRFVVMRQEFRLISRNIDADGAIAFAPFAGEAEVERFFDRFALPSILDDVPFRHLPEQVGASAGGVLFVARGAKAGTHHSAVVAAAFADSHAAQRSGGQAAVIVGKFEMRLGLPGIVARAETEDFRRGDRAR